MAAVAAVMAQRRIAEKRLEKQREKEDKKAFVQQILKKYDTSKSGLSPFRLNFLSPHSCVCQCGSHHTQHPNLPFYFEF